MAIRVNIDSDYMESLKQKVRESKNTNIISEALALYSWVADKKLEGKDVFSTDSSGKEVEKIIIPGLDKLKE